MSQERIGSRGDSRARILASAAHVFASYGYRKATFEEIAAGAGVSRTLLYRHFADKLDLLRAVRDQALHEWAETVDHAVGPTGSAHDALEALIGASLSFAGAHPIFRAFLAGDARLALHGELPAGPSRREWRDQTADLIRRGVAEGELAPVGDVRAAADVLCAMQLGLIEQMHADRDFASVLGPPQVDAAVRMLMGGLVQPWPPDVARARRPRRARSTKSTASPKASASTTPTAGARA